MKIFIRKHIIFIFFIFCFSAVFFFQNCGNPKIQLSSKQSAPLGNIYSLQSAFQPFVGIPNSNSEILRAVFFVDISASNAIGVCSSSDKIQYLDEDLRYYPNCTQGQWGSDPRLARLRIISEWMKEIEDYILKKGFGPDQFKAILIPFSGPKPLYSTLSVDWGQPKCKKENNPPQHCSDFQQLTFDSPQSIRQTAEFLMALQLARSGEPNNISLQETFLLPDWYNSHKNDGIDLEPEPSFRLKGKNLASALMQVSYPETQLNQMFDFIRKELGVLRANKLSQNTRFELVYLSDGFQKPRIDHFIVAAYAIWANRKIYRDLSYIGKPGIYCNPSGYTGPEDFFKSIDYTNSTPEGLNCEEIAKEDLKEFLLTGVIPPRLQAQQLSILDKKIQKCLWALQDIKSDSSGMNRITCLNERGIDIFDLTRRDFGDINRNTTDWILYKLRQIEGLFQLEYPEVFHHGHFVRVENNLTLQANSLSAKPLLTDLIPEKNWLIGAQKAFPSHNHKVIHDGVVDKFPLFSRIGTTDSYHVGTIFAVNMNARTNINGEVETDSDGDGISDLAEMNLLNTGLKFDLKSRRSDGRCLDSIVYQTHFCPQTILCDPLIDMDHDGLNQCEEMAIGTSDKDFDYDNDGIPDGLEVVFGYLPTVNDQKNSSTSRLDNRTNFEKFLLGLPSSALIEQIPENKKNKIFITDDGSHNYSIRIENIVSSETLGSIAKEESDSSLFFGRKLNKNQNQILIFVRMDNAHNPGDSYWLYFEKVIDFSIDPIKIEVSAEQFKSGNFLDPRGD